MSSTLIECPCCGGDGAESDGNGLFFDGQDLTCGCDGMVSVCPEDGVYINSDCPCGDEETLREAWVQAKLHLEAERWNAANAIPVIHDQREAILSLHDQISEWQSATGLNAGGDPSGVTPEMLREYVGRVSGILAALATTPVYRLGSVQQKAIQILADYPEE